MWSHITGAVK